MIPLRERLVTLTQQQYDAMLVGTYQLLATKQNEVNAYASGFCELRCWHGYQAPGTVSKSSRALRILATCIEPFWSASPAGTSTSSAP